MINKKTLGMILGILIIIILMSIFTVHLMTIKEFGKLEEGISTVFLSIYIFCLGFLFLISYFFSNYNFLFKSIRWVYDHSMGSNEGKIAFFYFVISLLLGIITLLYGFGILHQ